MIPETCVIRWAASLRAMTGDAAVPVGRGLAAMVLGVSARLGLLLWALFSGGHAAWAGWRLRDSGGGGTFRLFSVTSAAPDGTRSVHEPWLLVYHGSAGLWRGWIEGALLIAFGVLVCAGPGWLRVPAAVLLGLVGAVWALDIAGLLVIDRSLVILAWPALLAAGIGMVSSLATLGLVLVQTRRRSVR